MKTRYFNSALSILFLFVMIGMPGQVFAENVLKIGGSLTTTGPAAHLGTVCLNGVKVAVDVINEKGGVEVGGEKYLIEFINYDDKCCKKSEYMNQT